MGKAKTEATKARRAATLRTLEAMRAAVPKHRKDWRRTLDGYINRLEEYGIEPEPATLETMRRTLYPDAGE